MRSVLTIFLLLFVHVMACAQTPASVTLETDYFTINFPGIPEFECDTLQDSMLVVNHSYSFESEDDQSFAIVYRDRMDMDNKHNTFEDEIDWMCYWTSAAISEKKKGKLNGHPTLHFIAKMTYDTYHFQYILTETHFIRIGVGREDGNLSQEAADFLDSFKLK